MAVFLEEPYGKQVEVCDFNLDNERQYLDSKGKKAKFQFQSRLVDRTLTLSALRFDIVDKQKPASDTSEECAAS